MADPSAGFLPAGFLRERDDDDARLLARIAAGDERALGSLYDAYGAVVYGLAAAITRNPAEAEAAVADAFAAVWREARTFDPAGRSTFGWLSALVRSHALRRRAPDAPAALLSASESSPVSTALARLTAVQRRVVELAYLRGFSRQEIADVLGESENVVGVALRTAMESLRRALLPDTAFPPTAEASPRLVAGL